MIFTDILTTIFFGPSSTNSWKDYIAVEVMDNNVRDAAREKTERMVVNFHGVVTSHSECHSSSAWRRKGKMPHHHTALGINVVYLSSSLLTHPLNRGFTKWYPVFCGFLVSMPVQRFIINHIELFCSCTFESIDVHLFTILYSIAWTPLVIYYFKERPNFFRRFNDGSPG